MKNLKSMISLTLAAALTATLAVGALAAEVESEEPDMIEVEVADLISAYGDNENDLDLLISPRLDVENKQSNAAGTFDISVNGADLGVQATVMVPLRRVAKALGYTVTWNGDNTVFVDNGRMHTTVTFGQDRYFAATSIPGMIGMTAPFSLGVPPYCVDGVTYVPLGLFQVLEGNSAENLDLVGDRLIINTAPKEEEKVDVVIVSVEEKFTEDELNALLEKYNMTVVYDYTNFNMYAFRLPEALGKADMAALLAKLEAEKGILSAQADSKVYLMDEDTSAQ